MAVSVADYRYELVPGWGRMPYGWPWRLVSGVAADADGRIFVFSRTEHPVVVFDGVGEFLTSWGEGIFTHPHGICVGPDGSVYCTDAKDHTVRKFSPDGRLLLTLGVKGEASDTGYDGKSFWSVARAGAPFNRPTCVAIAPNGDVYVGDGYGNCCVHRFAEDGRLILSWGKPGSSGPGEFVVIHGIQVDSAGRVWVADRENGRIQAFSAGGEFLFEWGGFYRPMDVASDADDNVYIAEGNGQVRVFQPDGTLLSRWGKASSETVRPDEVLGKAHTIAVDTQGDVYVGSADRGFLKKFRLQR